MRNGSPRHSPRSFCGDAFPWPSVVDLTDGTEVTACYVVHEKRRAETRQNKPYLRLVLGDRSGTIEAVIWDDAERWDPVCDPDSILGVQGRVSVYQEKLQLKVHVVEPLRVEDDDLSLFLPASPRPWKGMCAELERLLEGISDPPLRRLLERCLGAGTEMGRRFRVHPAAKRNHHAYIGGLLEHSISVAGICDRLAQHYNAQGIGPSVDRDLLIAGALLHDIGKLRELRASAGFAYTHEGQLLGHIVVGMQLVRGEAERIPDFPEERLLLLLHLIASHQGRLEWASPKVPQLLEALLLHYADDLDSKMNPALQLLSGVAVGAWSAYDRHLERSLFHPPPLGPGSEVEPVAPTEVGELFMDLFSG